MTSFTVESVPHADHDAAIRAVGKPVQIEQSEQWAAYEAGLPGRDPWRTLLIHEDEVPVAAVALVRYTGRAMTQQWAKHGPTWLIDGPTPDQERDLRTVLADYIRREDPKAAVLRLHAFDSEGCVDPLVATQWDRTVIVNIDRSDDDIMATMSKSGRRDLRYGLKNDDVVITDDTDTDFARFSQEVYPIFAETAGRAGFGLMSARNYYAIVETLRPDHARLFVARLAGQPISWGLFTFLDGVGTYYFAASSSAARNTFAVYKLLWHGITELRQQGVKTLDFYGVSSPRCPELASLDDFKLKWTKGVATDVAGAWDVVLRPEVIRLYHARGTALALAQRTKGLLRRAPGLARTTVTTARETLRRPAVPESGGETPESDVTVRDAGNPAAQHDA